MARRRKFHLVISLYRWGSSERHVGAGQVHPDARTASHAERTVGMLARQIVAVAAGRFYGTPIPHRGTPATHQGRSVLALEHSTC